MVEHYIALQNLCFHIGVGSEQFYQPPKKRDQLESKLPKIRHIFLPWFQNGVWWTPHEVSNVFDHPHDSRLSPSKTINFKNAHLEVA
jgi:hypothetical protein